MRRATLYVALVLCGACSLRSLDYLESGADSAGSDGGPGTGHGGKSGSGGSADVSGSNNSSGTVGEDGGSPSKGGNNATSGNSNSEAGAGGALAEEVPDCTDKLQTVDETDKDCGGRTCAPCAAGLRCLTGSDCQSAICTNQICQAPTCTDLAVNGDETDLNCGGKCGGCAEGQHCSVGADCSSKSCEAGMCASATCPDGMFKQGCPLLVQNTPYRLSPSNAPAKCIDDNKQSVAEGNAMLLYSCKDEIHQTFWVVAKADGYFALRNGLSGKCLQVRGASMDENAVVEQANCDYQPEQLWKPSIVDATSLRLTAKHSGLVLDVAGSNVGEDSQPIVQGKASDSADTHWQVVRRTAGAYIAFSPYKDQTVRISHAQSTVTTSSDDMFSAHWKVIAGMADPACVSFQSRDEPGRFLRHAGYRLWADLNDGTDIFRKDGTFCYREPFEGTKAITRALEAVNYAGSFLVARDGIVKLEALGNSTEFYNSATWWLGAR